MTKKAPAKKTARASAKKPSLPPGVARLVRKKVVGSTQTLARELADKDAPAWTLVWADRQSHGRGRMDRKFSSGPGGLYLTVVLRPKMDATGLGNFSLRTGRLLTQAVAVLTGVRTKVKLPNDVLARCPDGRWRKVCGILIEAAGDSRHIDWVVVGVGININNKVPKSLPNAASLRDLAGREFQPEAVLAALLGRFQAAWGD